MQTSMKLGIWSYGLGTILTGILNLAWGAFDSSHQPIQALGISLPAQHVLAYVIGIWLIAAGVAILFPGTRKIAAIASAAVYLLFVGFWVARYSAGVYPPGRRISFVLSTCFALAQQLLLMAPAVLLSWAASPNSLVQKRAAIATRWMLGVPPILFGVFHLVGLHGFASIVPHWIPFATFWAAFTGVAFILAGCAICSGKLDVLALKLLALMLLLFEPLVEIPPIFTRLHHQPTWGAAVYNITAIGACLIFAAYLTHRDRERHGPAADRTLSGLGQLVA